MEITKISPTLDLCQEGKNRFFRGRKYNTKGLTARVLVPGDDGSVLYAVETGGTGVGHYVVSGGHTPLQVQSAVREQGGVVTIGSLGLQYAFGDRGGVVGEEARSKVEVAICNFIDEIASYPELVDEEIGRLRDQQIIQSEARMAQRLQNQFDGLRAALQQTIDSDGVALCTDEQIDAWLNPLFSELLWRMAMSAEARIEKGMRSATQSAEQVRTQAEEAMGSYRRLSEREVKELAFQAAVGELGQKVLEKRDYSMLRVGVDAAFSAISSANYSGGFPDRAVDETRPDTASMARVTATGQGIEARQQPRDPFGPTH